MTDEPDITKRQEQIMWALVTQELAADIDRPNGYIEHRFRQVECDWQWPDGRYCNMTVHFYALAASSPQGGRTDVEASLAGYCSLEHATPRHARRWTRTSSCTGRSSRARPVSVGIALAIASASRRYTNSSTPIQTRSR